MGQVWSKDRSASYASERRSAAQRSDLEEPATFWWFVGSILEVYSGLIWSCGVVHTHGEGQRKEKRSQKNEVRESLFPRRAVDA